MSASHTPGPWTYVPEDNIITTYAGRRIAEFQPRSIHVGDEERAANGFLLAAAPDLLEALEPFAKFACDVPNDCFNCKARAAIKKAKGQ